MLQTDSGLLEQHTSVTNRKWFVKKQEIECYSNNHVLQTGSGVLEQHTHMHTRVAIY